MKVPAAVPRIRDYLQIMLSGWLVILCGTMLSAGVGFLVWQTAPPMYQSGTKLLIVTPGNATTIDAYYGQANAALRAPTFVQLARSGHVTTRTIEQLGLLETSDALAARIAVTPSTPVLLDLTVTGTDRELTRETADAVADNMVVLSRQMAAVETADTELAKVGDAGFAQRQGSMWQKVLEGAALGLVLSSLLVIAHGLVRGRLLARSEIVRIVDETLTDPNR
ncbi:YveK family protein [Mycobacterium deserti]|uniref:Polysaccharide chain length determinant N-terminal domain-containing protein n=1 Tax=Mycobacterium deserti TaxID=2978347 RepID=A0ABT2MG01_9MYCO|nr:hypothetical protein [Mycobacterium deserti]MCT7660896.1 hypothetical protein [Mycobacterium deserti]